MNKQYHGIGLMSGTSLDGVDLSYCTYHFENDRWQFQLKASVTYPIDDVLLSGIKEAIQNRLADHSELDQQLGEMYGRMINQFIDEKDIATIDFVASHGQTIFHDPSSQKTIQLGSGQAIANSTQTLTVNDFRSLDVSLGGQGAPLVPIGDWHFFNNHSFCLNLGGIANATFQTKEKVVAAADLSLCNAVMNHFANIEGLPFDEDGRLAEASSSNPILLDQLDELVAVMKGKNKSMDVASCLSFYLKCISPEQEKMRMTSGEVLATLCEHVGRQVKYFVEQHPYEPTASILISGGGAFNSYLIYCIRKETLLKIEVPDQSIIEFKEAIIFGLLGLLKLEDEINCLRVVTGAREDNCGGVIWKPSQEKLRI